MAYCQSFNFLLRNSATYVGAFPDRFELIEKRLIENWFFYQALKLKEQLNGILNDSVVPYMMDLDEMLRQLKPKMATFFVSKWSGIFHRSICVDPKCSLTFTVDGNHKCNRLKCMCESGILKIPEIGYYSFKKSAIKLFN
jgi:hypothetical protein